MCKVKIALSKLLEKFFLSMAFFLSKTYWHPWKSGGRMTLWSLKVHFNAIPYIVWHSKTDCGCDFWWAERINAKLSLFPHVCVGVCFDTVRESACMACKRSPVRSRYSPPKKHCTSFEVRCFSFYWSRFLGAALLCLHRFQAFAGGSYTTPNVWRYTIFKLESDLNLPSEKTEKSYSNLGILLLCPTWRKSFRKLPHCLSPNGR